MKCECPICDKIRKEQIRIGINTRHKYHSSLVFDDTILDERFLAR